MAARAAMARHWDPDSPDTAAAVGWPAAPVGVYVSLLRGRATRACVGMSSPSSGTLSAAVAELAVQALAADPRRPPVRREELAEIKIVIAFAGESEPIADPSLADPAREGFAISTERGSVAFLPGEARTIAWALREARRSGVLGAGPATYRRFPVVAISEPERKHEAANGER